MVKFAIKILFASLFLKPLPVSGTMPQTSVLPNTKVLMILIYTINIHVIFHESLGGYGYTRRDIYTRRVHHDSESHRQP